MRPDTVTHTELYLIFQVNPKKTKRDLEVKQAKFAEAKVSLEDVTEELLARYHKWARVSVPNVVLRQLQGFVALQVHIHRHGADAFEGCLPVLPSSAAIYAQMSQGTAELRSRVETHAITRAYSVRLGHGVHKPYDEGEGGEEQGRLWVEGSIQEEGTAGGAGLPPGLTAEQRRMITGNTGSGSTNARSTIRHVRGRVIIYYSV